MSAKKIIGVVLTLLGIGALIYTAMLFMNTKGGVYDIKLLVVYGILGMVFFGAGIGLVKTTKDE